MLATLTGRPFSDPNWVFEPKLDGVRMIAVVRSTGTKLYSRRGLDASHLFPSIVALLGEQAVPDCILDGEIIAVDERGAPSFQRLQCRLNLNRPEEIARLDRSLPVTYYVFDILYAAGSDLRGLTWTDRHEALMQSLTPCVQIRVVFSFEEDGVLAFKEAVRLGFEGVVAKRRDSVYESARRSHRWLKVKAVQSDDFIIGGYSKGIGRRAGTFGALLVGQLDTDGRLQYAGHVGTGFDAISLQELLSRMEVLQSDQCPFVVEPPLNMPTTWVRPEMVTEIKFMQRTRDGILRAPVFMRLRDDKPASQARPAEAL